MKHHLGCAACVLLLGVCPAMASGKADSLYINGHILTVDSTFSKASILAVKDHTLIYVGNDLTAAQRLTDETTRTVDLGGKTVLPGLIDGHMHLLLEGQRLTELPITGASREAIVELVKAEASRLAPGEWITGDGWNNELWADTGWPGRAELDAVAPNNPVVLGRVDRHAVWVNSAALKLAGIDKQTPNPQGGDILKDARGELLGVLVDTAQHPVQQIIPVQGDDRQKEALLAAQQELFASGITSIADAGQSLRTINLMRTLYQTGELTLRTYVMLDSSQEQDRAWLATGSKPFMGLYDNRMTLRAVKIMSDGALGSRGAWLLQAYADSPGQHGAGRYTDAELYTIMKRARDNNLQVAVHAIGDAAVRQSVNTMGRVLRESPLADHRYRIEHFQVVQPEDLSRSAKEGIMPSMQAVHMASDWPMAEKRVGPEAIKTSYAWRDAITAAGMMVNGSDAPVEPVNPWHGLYVSVTRADLDGKPEGGWYPRQKMSREEAVRSFTIWPAHGQFEEHLKGSLEKGKLADFVVIDRDIMTCPESDIKKTEVLMTVVGGEVVFAKP